MKQSTYQAYLDARQAHNQAYAAILSELVAIAKQAEAALAAHPDHERIAEWIEHGMGFDGAFDRYHIFQYDSSERVVSWSQDESGDFILTTKERHQEGDLHQYTIPAAWVFAEPAERAKLIQAELDTIAGQAKAHDAAKQAEAEQADRATYEALRERFGS